MAARWRSGDDEVIDLRERLAPYGDTTAHDAQHEVPDAVPARRPRRPHRSKATEPQHLARPRHLAE